MIEYAEAPARRRHGRLRPALAVSMGVVLVLVTLFGIGATRAAWHDAEYARASLATAVVPPPGALGCSGGGTFVLGNTPPTVTFAWAAAGTPANALPVTDYYWTLMSGSTLITSGTTTTTARTAAIAGTVVPAAGNYAFKVVARNSSGWVSATGPTGTYTKTDAILGILLGTSGCTVP
jgi:hypothetical protein